MTGFAAVLAALAVAQSDPSAAPAEAERARPAAAPAPAPRRPRPAAAAAAPAPSPAEPERTQAAKAALAFLDALVAGDADALAAAGSERFSFDGETKVGRDAVRTAWRGVLAGRTARGTLLDLELLPAAEAVARLGPPPARVAPLAQRGGWIGIADVSGRAVIVFLAREGGRFVVTGMHD